MFDTYPLNREGGGGKASRVYLIDIWCDSLELLIVFLESTELRRFSRYDNVYNLIVTDQPNWSL